MSEAALLPRSWPLSFDFLTFKIHFMLDSDPNQVLERIRNHMHSGSAKAKNYVSCCSGSGSTTLLHHFILSEPFFSAQQILLGTENGGQTLWELCLSHLWQKIKATEKPRAPYEAAHRKEKLSCKSHYSL
jgi:hypothetical protein